jgi:hypothetical protein
MNAGYRLSDPPGRKACGYQKKEFLQAPTTTIYNDFMVK